MKKSIILFACFIFTSSLFGQFSAKEREIVDGMVKEMCNCIEAETMKIKTYQAFNAALIHCMNYETSKFKPLIDSLYIQKDEFDFLVKLPDEISKGIRKDCQIVAEFYEHQSIPDLANKIQYHVAGFTIAVDSMEQMVDFYANVFDMDFEKLEKHGGILYQGKWGEQAVLFCPADIAQITAKQNRHQFDLNVNDLDKAIELIIANGGTVSKESKDDLGIRSVTAYDPDGNSLVFRERI